MQGPQTRMASAVLGCAGSRPASGSRRSSPTTARSNRRILASLLESAGVHVITAAGGLEAIELARAHRPEVVLHGPQDGRSRRARSNAPACRD